MYAHLAQEAVVALGWAERLPLIALTHELIHGARPMLGNTYSAISSLRPPSWPVSSFSTAFIFHTSGTSTGLPKPIPQSHHAAVGVLPRLPNGSEKATLTITPLYHGGIADCLRAWSSGAMIWLFPAKDVPITAMSVVKSFQSALDLPGFPPIKYFSSVPYVLQMVAAEDKGLQMLKNMDLVGVGGAALPSDIGNDLVGKGVNLLSRFGSAECGFLMSSHREYEKDKEWQYLRSSGSDQLKFEAQGDGLAELVIQPQWPHMAQRNRKDGSFATADLFEPHYRIHDAWRYHSRADSQLTLITGKKFDPAPLEAAIATSPLLSDALIYGNGQQYPGVLLFPSAAARGLKSEEVKEKVWQVLSGLNSNSQSHARIPRSMLKIVPEDAAGLEKSSKGTVLRGQAEKEYARDIHDMYNQKASPTQAVNGSNSSVAAVPDEELLQKVLEIIQSVTASKKTIPENGDLFSYGIDSVASIQIRAKLQAVCLSFYPSDILLASLSPKTNLHIQFLDTDRHSLPLNIVYDCGSAAKCVTVSPLTVKSAYMLIKSNPGWLNIF